jgi:hypothetical protein
MTKEGMQRTYEVGSRNHSISDFRYRIIDLKYGFTPGLHSHFGGVDLLSLFLNGQNTFLRHSIFVIRYSAVRFILLFFPLPHSDFRLPSSHFLLPLAFVL